MRVGGHNVTVELRGPLRGTRGGSGPGTAGWGSRWGLALGQASSARRILPPSLRASPPHRAARRPPAASPAPAGAGAEAAASAPPPGLSRSEQECLSNQHGSPVPSPDVDSHFTYYWCREVPINSGPRRPALTLGAWLRGRGGGASLIVVLSVPELSLERNRLRKAVLPCEF